MVEAVAKDEFRAPELARAHGKSDQWVYFQMDYGSEIDGIVEKLPFVRRGRFRYVRYSDWLVFLEKLCSAKKVRSVRRKSTAK